MDSLSFKHFALSCQYLKESIDIPKFFDINQGYVHDEKTDVISLGDVYLLPTANLRSADLSPSSLSELLGLLTSLTLRPIRYEPRNVSPLHAAVPRPGGRAFCTRLYVLIPKGQRAQCFRYEQEANGLHLLGEIAERIENPQLLIAVDPARISDGYGEFALTVGLLEAGHSLAQIQAVLGALGMNHILTVNGQPALPASEGAQICVGRIDLPIAPLEIDIDNLEQCSVLVRGPRLVAEIDKNFPRLTAAIACLKSAQAAGEGGNALYNEVGPSNLAAEEIRDWSTHRTSSIDGMGTVPAKTSSDQFQKVLKNWQRLHELLPLTGRIEIRLALCSVGSVPPQITTFGLLHGQFEASEAGDIATVLKPNIGIGAGYNTEEYAFFAFLSCPIARILEEEGILAYSDMMLEAGMIAQTLGLACASQGLFSRPLRAYREAMLEQALGLDDQLLYLVACGNARIANPQISIP